VYANCPGEVSSVKSGVVCDQQFGGGFAGVKAPGARSEGSVQPGGGEGHPGSLPVVAGAPAVRVKAGMPRLTVAAGCSAVVTIVPVGERAALQVRLAEYRSDPGDQGCHTSVVQPEPDPRWARISGGAGPDGRMRPMSYEILAGLASKWPGLLPDTMIVDGPAKLLGMARSQFALSWFDYGLMVSASLTGFQALEAAFRVLYPEAERTPFRALIRKARQDSVMPDNIADLAAAGAELRNSFSHPLTRATLTLGMAVLMLENTHRLVALVMTAAAERDAAWRNRGALTTAAAPSRKARPLTRPFVKGAGFSFWWPRFSGAGVLTGLLLVADKTGRGRSWRRAGSY
jgi:hypothetical protein